MSCSCGVNIAHLPAMSALVFATLFFRGGCTGLNQAVDLGRAITDLLEDLACMRAVVGRCAWLLFFAVGDEDRTAHGFDHAMAGIFEICRVALRQILRTELFRDNAGSQDHELLLALSVFETHQSRDELLWIAQRYQPFFAENFAGDFQCKIPGLARRDTARRLDPQ